MATATIHRTAPVPFTGQTGEYPGDEAFLDLPGADARMVFCWCPPGTFLMGSPETEPERGENEIQHEVTLTHGFWLAKHPCNQAQYGAITGKNPSSFQSGETWPVDSVSWDDAQAYCEALEKAAPSPEGWRWALPTEAQWEYACRAGAPADHPFAVGDGKNFSSQLGNFDGNYPYGDEVKWSFREKTTDQGSFPPNPWGLHDMHGQLFEWCEDGLGDYPENPVTDPLATFKKEGYRVLRGGDWSVSGRFCRTSFRYGRTPGYRSRGCGFRLSQVPKTSREAGG